MTQYEIVISGRVQGVGFRYYVYKKANEFKITGWVKNTVEGNVLVVVQGDESVLNTFIDFLYIGPPLARVDKVTRVQMNIVKEFAGFEVRY